jgi:hypothetical protein
MTQYPSASHIVTFIRIFYIDIVISCSCLSYNWNFLENEIIRGLDFSQAILLEMSQQKFSIVQAVAASYSSPS